MNNYIEAVRTGVIWVGYCVYDIEGAKNAGDLPRCRFPMKREHGHNYWFWMDSAIRRPLPRFKVHSRFRRLSTGEYETTRLWDRQITSGSNEMRKLLEKP